MEGNNGSTSSKLAAGSREGRWWRRPPRMSRSLVSAVIQAGSPWQHASVRKKSHHGVKESGRQEWSGRPSDEPAGGGRELCVLNGKTLAIPPFSIENI